MSLDTDVTGFLLGVLEQPPMLSSNATTFLDPIVSAGIEDAVSSSTTTTTTTEAAAVWGLNLTSSSSSPAAMDPFMASTYDKLKCGHFTVVDKKLHFTIGEDSS